MIIEDYHGRENNMGWEEWKGKKASGVFEMDMIINLIKSDQVEKRC